METLLFSIQPMIRDEEIRERLKEVDEDLRKGYIEREPSRERERGMDWRTYEQLLSKRIREAMKKEVRPPHPRGRIDHKG